MPQPKETPIITRLKEFMSYTKLTNSQFADYASIPRPTLSQLLHGRNKTVSDLLMNRLHCSFPNLNMLWFMFGKGDMLIDPNIEFSGAQEVQKELEFPTETTEDEAFIDDEEDERFVSSSSAKKMGEIFLNQKNGTTTSEAPAGSTTPPQVAEAKKVSMIIVIYSDNSIETFSPDKTPNIK